MGRSAHDLPLPPSFFLSPAAGVISTPHKAVHHIGNSDRAIVLASDGLWDFVSNEETSALALSTQDTWEAAARLARLARSRWLSRTGGADDTTIVIVRLGNNANANANATSASGSGGATAGGSGASVASGSSIA